MTLPASIFKKYDIRGKASGEGTVITTDAARVIAQAFGTFLQANENKKTVIVGRDNRNTSFDLMAAAVDGLLRCECDVIDIGLVSTPLVYWHAVQNDDAGGLMITGSHLAPDQNGFKLTVGNRNLYGDQIQELRKFIATGRLFFGKGSLTTNEKAYAEYVKDIESRVKMARGLRVAVDPGNGTGGVFAPRLLRAWGHDVVCIFCEPDGAYPHHQPDPQNPANMEALSKTVVEHGADLGLAFDGDADRVGVTDEKGQIIAADRLLALLARDMLKRQPGAAVVADVLSSQVLFDEIKRAGGEPVFWASGHSLVKAKMREVGALLGGEMSGHIFLGEDYYGFDDAYLAAGRLLQLLAASDKPLSELNAAMPTLYSTPEYRPRCPDEEKEKVIAGVQEALNGKGDVVAVDGIRIQFDKGWGLLRASNTEPVLSLRFEGESEADALAYRDLFANALRQFPQVESII